MGTIGWDDLLVVVMVGALLFAAGKVGKWYRKL